MLHTPMVCLQAEAASVPVSSTQTHPGNGRADDPGNGRAGDPGKGRAGDPGNGRAGVGTECWPLGSYLLLVKRNLPGTLVSQPLRRPSSPPVWRQRSINTTNDRK